MHAPKTSFSFDQSLLRLQKCCGQTFKSRRICIEAWSPFKRKRNADRHRQILISTWALTVVVELLLISSAKTNGTTPTHVRGL